MLPAILNLGANPPGSATCLVKSLSVQRRRPSFRDRCNWQTRGGPLLLYEADHLGSLR